jgi:hypothetical protein
MHVSYAEMARNAPEVLRMLGVSYGQADDSVEGFLLTHAALDVGYELLALTDQADKSAWRAPAISLEGATYHIDLGNQSLLLFAARISDVVAIRALGGAGSDAIVTDAIGGWMAPYICFRLATMGLHTTVGWIPREGVTGDAPLLTVAAAAPAGGPDDVVCYVNVGERPAAAPTDCGGILFIEARSGPVRAGSFQLRGQELRIMPAVKAFIAEGREVDPAIHTANFASIQWRMRVAPSERSRGQAG